MQVLPSQVLLLTKAIHKLAGPGSAPVMLMDEPVTQPDPKIGCDKHGQVRGCFDTSHLGQVGVKHLQTCATVYKAAGQATTGAALARSCAMLAWLYLLYQSKWAANS